MKQEYEVTFHLSSGETFIVNYSKEKLDEMWKTLSHSWTSSIIASDEWGISFAHVTYYKVKKND